MNGLPSPAQLTLLGAPFAKPLVFPSQISHVRLFPKAHRFAYSYLLVGVPIVSEGVRCGVLTADTRSRGWLSVDGKDHLDRGIDSLHDKVTAYLRSVVRNNVSHLRI